MNKLSTAKRTAILAALVEGNPIRATCRVARNNDLPYRLRDFQSLAAGLEEVRTLLNVKN
ncbi:MAG: hypothetical protein JSU86_11315 [Phycisphaerales bacterium]|nr:MAG: hypothetical protein JSU86_11315 [Phycisphaerales bacterium]